ncbi:MAG: hypothetical protein HXX16_12780 [Bacteroidales bacterium]|nr:hypothetical protein [Bacteroidales bacterium]
MKTLDFNEMSKVQGGLEGDDYWTCVAAATIVGAHWGPFAALIGFAVGAAAC